MTPPLWMPDPNGPRFNGDRSDPTIAIPACALRRVPFWAVFVLVTSVYACSIYVNLSFAVKNSADYRFFPPFQRHVNANNNGDLASENFNIARSLAAGAGFADPFPGRRGPTAWMAPALPAILAGLLWVCDGSRDAVMAVVVFLQVNVLIGTGFLVVALALKTTSRTGAGLAVAIYFVGLFHHFWLCFQLTQDCWLVLLAIDLLIAGFCLRQPLESKTAAVAWGLVGGFCTLVNPIVGMTWAVLCLLIGFRRGSRLRCVIALLLAGLVCTPWIVRNYLVFGRLIPVKCNLAYELYQSQCLQPDGLVQRGTFHGHPYNASTREGQEYENLGEVVFLERKREQFWLAVSSHPWDFLKRLADRFLGATLWYTPFDRAHEKKQPWLTWLNRFIHPVPFLAVLSLLITAARQPIQKAQWIVMGICLLYLLPYIGISYYDRYAMPLVGVKALLVIWAIDRLLIVRGER